MRSSFLIAVLLSQLMACASQPTAVAPGCHGARRPANPYGSVLSDSASGSKTPDAAPTPRCGSQAR